MLQTEEVLRLIIVDDSSNYAEIVSSLLRSNGQAVRMERVEDDEDLAACLARDAWDMVIVQAGLEFCLPSTALQIIKEKTRGMPLILLMENIDETEVGDLFGNGLSNMISLKQPRHLVHTLIREFDHVLKQRSLLTCNSLLQEANKRSQALVDSSRDAVAYVHEGMYIYANESYLQMFGYSTPDEIEGMPLMDMISGKDQDKFKEFLRGYLKGQTSSDSLSLHGRKTSGEEFSITMEFSPASYDGEPCIQILIYDKASDKELEEKLQSLTKVDLITGVYNRQYFMAVLENELGKDGTYGAVFYIKPDNFMAMRDRLGISGSDLLLTDFAMLLEQITGNGENNITSRFESEAFTLLLPQMDEKTALELAKNILEQVEKNIFEASDQTISMTCSIGIALYAEGLDDINELLQRSEKAYRKASTTGNRSFFYNPQTEGMVERELAGLRVRQVKKGLQENLFVLYFQPIVSLRGDPGENYEVFLRLRDEDKILTPGEFIPAAAAAGLMPAIDRWVIVNTIKKLAERLKAGHQTSFFIKIAADSVQDNEFSGWLQKLVQEARVPGSHLVLELYESVVSRNLKRVQALREELQKLQIRIVIEHFGQDSNYSNLLRHIQADYLKLHRSLIDNLSQSTEKQEKIKEIATLAEQMNIKTITDFIEDASTLSTLWTCNIDYIQGHFLQEPDPEMNYDFSTS